MPMNKPSGSPIDFTRVREVAEGDHRFERQVLMVYLSDADSRLQQIANAVAASDFATAVLECHNLKGASGNVGAFPMRGIAELCEKAARAKDSAGCQAAIEQALPELALLRGAIEAYLDDAPRH